MTLDGKIVLVRHRKGDRTYHLLPGGGVTWGETLEDSLIREVREETGLVASIGRPLIISDTISPNGDRHLVNITFEASVTGGSITQTPQDERVEAVDLVRPEAIVELDLRPPLSAEIAAYVADPSNYRTKYVGSLYSPE